MNKREWRQKAKDAEASYQMEHSQVHKERLALSEVCTERDALLAWQRVVRETVPEEYDLIAVGTCRLICLNTDDWLRLRHAIEDEPVEPKEESLVGQVTNHTRILRG